jgi:hypothetical protein
VEDREPKRKKGGTPEVALVERHKTGDLENGVWVKVMEVDAVEIKEMTEEFRGGESQAVLQKPQKDHELTGFGFRLVLAGGDLRLPAPFSGSTFPSMKGQRCLSTTVERL